jgi:hypothetical protein
MSEWVAVLLTIALIAVVVWLLFAGIIGAIYGDIVEGVMAATVIVGFIAFIFGAMFGVYALIQLIWSGVPS